MTALNSQIGHLRWQFQRFDSFLFPFAVRDGDTVKHYRIRQLDEGGFFIARRTTFRTLQELVDHYSKDPDGLCVNLRKPCIQVRYSRENVFGPSPSPLRLFYKILCPPYTLSPPRTKKKTVFFQKSRLKRIFFDFGSDRKTSYWRIVTQHQRSMGNRQIVVEICAETWSWAVWRSVGRSLEQYDAGRH